MRRSIFLAGSILLLAFSAVAQVSGGGKPFSFTSPLADDFAKAKVVLPAIDVPEMQRQAKEIYAKGEMLPAGKIFPVSYSPENSGVWTTLPNGDRVWRLLAEVPGAPATSLYFDNFYIPEGAVLYVYNAEKTHLIGSFGAHNNSAAKEFATEIVYTSEFVVEYYEKGNVKRPGSFTITGIANVYNAPEPPANIRLQNPKCCGFGTSGSCNVNVNCPEGTLWINHRNAVARILIKNGANQAWCSGALINNAAYDCKNYFLTANHCGAAVSAADKNQWIFYFNYQTTGCANPGSEPGSNTITGCTMRSSASNGANSSVYGSDFLLVEFNGAIPASYNVYFAGFDATNNASNSGVSIHHASGDTKKISTYTTTTTSRRYYSQLPDNSHWQVNWAATYSNHGITEPGSSGAPLFHSNGRIMGKLSGGPSSCGAVAGDKNDYYGKLSYDWTSNGAAASQRLKPWLDPLNLGSSFVGGRLPCPANCPDILEPNNSQATAGTISTGVYNKALIAATTDQDYYKFTATTGVNITVSLTTLPFDYDLQLLNSAGTVIGSSAAGGSTNETIVFNGAAAGTYTVRVFGYNGAFSASSCYTLLVTTAVVPCNNTYEPNESLAPAPTIPNNTNINSQIASASDVDWYKFSNSALEPNIYVTLGNLPFDYDLYLYNSAGGMIGSSTSGGTTSESIIYNTSAVGTYYIRVIGYNGAFSNTLCYRLFAGVSGTPKAAWVQSTAIKDDMNTVTIAPNPVASKLNFSYTAAGNSMEEVIITDITGRKIMINTINSRPGKNENGIILPATLTKGIYILQVGTRNPVKFMKE
ncbi:MAG: pre-peptidase C-terminal domain-containing protein [Chitinophagaceae bacterium]|nr:pre-peptidase C-terminal domain-containing protein [Chitinophagaceae bacterium]